MQSSEIAHAGASEVRKKIPDSVCDTHFWLFGCLLIGACFGVCDVSHYSCNSSAQSSEFSYDANGITLFSLALLPLKP